MASEAIRKLRKNRNVIGKEVETEREPNDWQIFGKWKSNDKALMSFDILNHFSSEKGKEKTFSIT